MNERSARNSLERGYKMMMIPAVVAVLAFVIFPLIGMFGIALSDFHMLRGSKGQFGFHNFAKMMTDARFADSVYVMTVLSVGGVVIQVLTGTFIAVGLHRIIPKWKLARGIFLIPFAVPGVAVALIWLSLFTPTLSPINAIFDLIGITVPAFLTSRNGALFAITVADTWTTYPFVMLIILAALQGISEDLDEAASLDGATRIQTFIYITLPLLVPALIMVSLFRFIELLKHFPLIFIMTSGGPGRSTQVTNYYAYVQTFQKENVAYGASIAVFLFIIAALVSLYVARATGRIGDA